jgi:integrase/recombinase XerD
LSSPSRVRVTGPLSGHAAGFRSALVAEGYRPNAVADQLRVLAHLSRWLEHNEISPQQLTRGRVLEFLSARRAEGYTLWLSEKGVAPSLAYLRRLGVVPLPEVVLPVTPADHLLAEFGAYLADERGLAAGTIAADLHVARLFLATRPAALDLDALTPAEVVAFVTAQCATRSGAYVTTGLRAFLRFCHLAGHLPRPLIGAVPRVASWRLAGVPKAVDPGIVSRLLASCDRRTTYGRRDFAVLMVLSRLGLRSGEAAALRLEDIDWRAGELVIRGKGPKLERLPLPHDVGAAIAAWLRRGRPRCSSREVFTRVRAPHQRLSSGGVGQIVRAASLRCGVEPIHAHQLRHTVATEMLAAGGGLSEIGQVLRHASPLTTAIYAKVDRDGLRRLASPWPVSLPGAAR